MSKTTIANPLYDTVFKYLMEDERIARTILSALVKRDIVEVKMRPQEYVDDKLPNITLYRVDFAATVREADNTESKILIELQKNWLPTETLRFRRYLSLQYENPDNMTETTGGRFALPMVAVYLLNHRVGDIEEPILYVNRQYTDYNEQPVTKGLPNPFIDSLTHESIIVQLPLLRGRVHNRVEKLLSVFDQTFVVGKDKRSLQYDDALYEGDKDMTRIVTRLLKAASNAEIRQEMNLEEEFMSELERRDTEVMQKDAQIAEQNAQIAEQNAQIAEQSIRLQKAVQTLSKTMPPDGIAYSLGLDVEEVKRLMRE